MSEAYIYACEKHEKLGTFSRKMTLAEFAALEYLLARVPEQHLDNCQVKGCQEKRDRVVVVGVAAP